MSHLSAAAIRQVHTNSDAKSRERLGTNIGLTLPLGIETGPSPERIKGLSRASPHQHFSPTWRPHQILFFLFAEQKFD
jgi:hypothetical protein